MLSLDVWNIVFTIINVLVLYLIIKKFLFGRVQLVLDKRKEAIDAEYKEAEDTVNKANITKSEYDNKLSTAQKEAQDILDKARIQAETERNATLEKTRKDSERMLDKAKRDIKLEQDKAINEAESEVANLALLAVRKILEAGDENDANSQN